MKNKNEKIASCPICKQEVFLPIWLVEKYGKLYAAYCNLCERAYKSNEILWKSDGKKTP